MHQMAEPEPLLETNELRVAFVRRDQRVSVVDGISYRLLPGKTLAIVGESGAGKTLSCRALLGLLPPDAVVSGSARFQRKELLGLTEREIRRFRGRDIGMVFQEPARSLNPIMQVGHQITETIREHEHLGWHAAATRAIELIELLGFSTPRTIYRSYAHQLSGGMQQRIMIAIALAGKPKLLIADEATRSLDVTTQAEIMNLLVDLQSQLGMAILMITHDLRQAATFANDVLVMKAGRSVEYGTASSLSESATMPYTRALFQAATASVTKPMTGEGSERPRLSSSSASPASAQPLLRACDIVQEYRLHGPWGTNQGAVRAVAGVSFDLNPGEALGLVGETGSGKSTLARTLLLEPPPISGSIFLDGIDLTRLERRQLHKKRRQIQIVFQDSSGSLNPKWSVYSIVEEPLHSLGTMTRRERESRVREVLELVQLPFSDYGSRWPQAMSSGQRQRVAIARALAPRPRMVILDEALSSLDALIQRQILELLQRLRAELGVALLMISHDLMQVAELCDHVAVMRAGRICEICPTAAWLGNGARLSRT